MKRSVNSNGQVNTLAVSLNNAIFEYALVL